jgi:6-phosphofructokinase 1
MNHIAVLTSGGDAPGMNAAIRSVVRLALSRRVQVSGVRHGFRGLMAGDFVTMDSAAVGGIIEEGGTILRTARSDAFLAAAGQAQAVEVLRRAGLDGLVVIGGNGSQNGALALHRLGVPVVGVPSTIDNDLRGTDMSVGADTALNTVVAAIDHIRDTAESHERTFVVETMGRNCGWLALNAALATGADAVLIPEVPRALSDVAETVRTRRRMQKAHTIIVVAEGAGDAFTVARTVGELSGTEIRVTVLGHIQRGGAPTAFDRILASRLAAAATDALLGSRSGLMMGLRGNEIAAVPMAEAVAAIREVNLALYQLEGIFSI